MLNHWVFFSSIYFDSNFNAYFLSTTSRVNVAAWSNAQLWAVRVKCCLLLAVTGGTSYSGYGGIYPQATTLQQVALVLKQAPAHATSVATKGTVNRTSPKPTVSCSTEMEKRPPQKQKFQELPVAPKRLEAAHQNSCQGSKFVKPGDPFEDLGVRNISTVSPPKKLIQRSTNGMPPPPPRTMPPPPPKFLTSLTQKADMCNSITMKPAADPIPDLDITSVIF